jgi:hypothetical protein
VPDEDAADEHGDEDARRAEGHGAYGPAAVRPEVLLGDVFAADVVRVRDGALGTGDALRWIFRVKNLKIKMAELNWDIRA